MLAIIVEVLLFRWHNKDEVSLPSFDKHHTNVMCITCVWRKNSSEISLGKCLALVVESWGQNAAKSGAKFRIFQKVLGRLLRMLGGRWELRRLLRNLGRPLRDENFSTEFYNPYYDGLLRWLVLVGFYKSSSQRRFTKGGIKQEARREGRRPF
ncbi:hypothetical protein AgCh_039223 [Apium graveolens]